LTRQLHLTGLIALSALVESCSSPECSPEHWETNTGIPESTIEAAREQEQRFLGYGRSEESAHLTFCRALCLLPEKCRNLHIEEGAAGGAGAPGKSAGGAGAATYSVECFRPEACMGEPEFSNF